MTNTLQTIKVNEKEIIVIDSREVAEMLGKEHKYILRDIEGTDTVVGIIPTLESANLHSQNYFIPTTYKAGTREYKCYLVTKMGCELLGNKQQGEKGILFTAKYVERFNKMEEALKDKNKTALPTDYLSALKALVASEEERQKLLEINKEQAPKADYYEKVLHSDKLITTTDIAKDLGMTARKLHDILNDLGIIYKQGKCWKVYTKYDYLIKEKYCDYHITEYNQTLKWTEKGREWIITILRCTNCTKSQI